MTDADAVVAEFPPDAAFDAAAATSDGVPVKADAVPPSDAVPPADDAAPAP